MKKHVANTVVCSIRATSLLTAVAISVIFLATQAACAEMDAAWLVGKWEATAPSPAGAQMEDRFLLTVKPDGTFEEAILSARGGRVYVVGQWKVSGESVILEGLYQGGPPSINATKKTLMLTRSGDALEGTRLTHYNSNTLPISFTRAK